jgi:pimeloyl-ACP methyl ester carboxylesterase
VAEQHEDYVKARSHFHTKLVRIGPAPQAFEPLTPPPGVTEVTYSSAPLVLKAWLSHPGGGETRHPAVLFLHGGYALDMGDWQTTAPYRDAGFVVMVPKLRGENGQPGSFSMFYDEVDDVLAAAEYLRRLPDVDPHRIFVAGHSVGGTMTLLAALSSRTFRAAAAFSGSPDQVLYVKLAPGAKERAPFDHGVERELVMRSPLAFSAISNVLCVSITVHRSPSSSSPPPAPRKLPNGTAGTFASSSMKEITIPICSDRSRTASRSSKASPDTLWTPRRAGA